jgi:transcriptional regulator with XRE-family HTH domain
MQNIPEQIKQLIKKSGKTQYQIAKDMGIKASTLQRVQKDDTWGTQINTAMKILDYLGYTIVIKKILKKDR